MTKLCNQRDAFFRTVELVTQDAPPKYHIIFMGQKCGFITDEVDFLFLIDIGSPRCVLEVNRTHKYAKHCWHKLGPVWIFSKSWLFVIFFFIKWLTVFCQHLRIFMIKWWMYIKFHVYNIHMNYMKINFISALCNMFLERPRINFSIDLPTQNCYKVCDTICHQSWSKCMWLVTEKRFSLGVTTEIMAIFIVYMVLNGWVDGPFDNSTSQTSIWDPAPTKKLSMTVSACNPSTVGLE